MSNNNTSTFPFVHLRAHTEYSITESTLRIGDLIQKAKESGQPAVAMTDIDNLFGAIRFYKQAREAGVKPILGVDMQIMSPELPREGGGLPSSVAESGAEEPQSAPVADSTKVHRMLLLCKDYESYKRLMELISRAYLENMFNGVPTIREEWLKEAGVGERFICLSGDEKSWLSETLMSETPEKATQIVDRYREIFAGNYYIELQRKGIARRGVDLQGGFIVR